MQRFSKKNMKQYNTLSFKRLKTTKALSFCIFYQSIQLQLSKLTVQFDTSCHLKSLLNRHQQLKHQNPTYDNDIISLFLTKTHQISDSLFRFWDSPKQTALTVLGHGKIFV